jgi:hypothetical protein
LSAFDLFFDLAFRLFDLLIGIGARPADGFGLLQRPFLPQGLVLLEKLGACDLQRVLEIRRFLVGGLQ